MHQKRTIPGLSLLLMAALLLVISGCGDDKVPAPVTNNQVPGDLEDPEFQAVQQQIDEYLSDAHGMFDLGLDNIYQLPADTEEVRVMHAAFGPNDTVAAAYVDGWHITYVSLYNLSFNSRFRDSVQFMVNSVPVESSNSLDYLHYIRYWNYEDNNTDETYYDKSGHLDIEFTNLDQDVCQVNGFNNSILVWNYISPDSTVEAIFDMVVEVNDVYLGQVPNNGWINACPMSGDLLMDIDEAYSVTINSSTDFWVTSWSATVEFVDGTASVEVIRNNVVWNYELDLCTPFGS